MKKVIVTGGSGFIGANLTRRLLRDGQEVHLLLRKGYKTWRIADIFKQVHPHIVDLQNATALKRLFTMIEPDWIFHTAAYGAYSTQNDLDEMIETNITGLSNLLEAAKLSGFDAFVNTGSSSEYGYRDTAPKETDCLDPNSHYAITKAAATHLCQYTAKTYRLHIPTLRLYSAYGPYEEPTRLMPTLLAHALKKRLPPLVNPKIARDFVHVEDIVDAYLLAAKHKTKELGPVYNIGSGTQTNMKKLVELSKKLFKITEKPRWGSMVNRSWDTSNWVSNSNKARKVLGWKPKFSLQQGLSSTYTWLENNQQAYQASFPKNA